MISLNVSCGDGRGEEGKRQDRRGREATGRKEEGRERIGGRGGGGVKIKNFIYL